jgi:membrane protease YdiL (CAAX protease family)
MSLPPHLIPEPSPEQRDELPETRIVTEASLVEGPAEMAAFEPVAVAPPAPRFPAWSWGDVVAVLVLTLFVVIGFSVAALFIARSMPAYRNVPFTELATNAGVVIGAQAAAYPIVILFMFVLVRSRAHERFSSAIRWNWPGIAAPSFFLGGIVLAIVVESASRFLPMPKSLPVDKYFNSTTSAYLMAAFGTTLAPLLEELFFRGMLYARLRRTFRLSIAVVLTGAAFAAIHGAQLGYAWAPVLSIFFVGVVFTLVRERTSSVASAFVMHCGYNFTLFGMLWWASDHYRHLEKLTG